MAQKVKVSCSKAAYERILEAAKGYFEDGICILGRNYYTCPAQRNKSVNCDVCLRKNIIRVNDCSSKNTTHVE